MLKSLVQLFAEKFLVSKKEWVSNQSQALVSGGTEIAFISSTDSQDYTAPCSGYVCIDGASNISYIEVGDGPRSRQQVAAATTQIRLAWPEVYMPVKKGDSCTYAAAVLDGNAENSTVYFIPAVGGQTS